MHKGVVGKRRVNVLDQEGENDKPTSLTISPNPVLVSCATRYSLYISYTPLLRTFTVCLQRDVHEEHVKTCFSAIVGQP
jgi:hypothetical protein